MRRSFEIEAGLGGRERADRSHYDTKEARVSEGSCKGRRREWARRTG
jgi:hypothetical protein